MLFFLLCCQEGKISIIYLKEDLSLLLAKFPDNPMFGGSPVQTPTFKITVINKKSKKRSETTK